MRSHQRTVRAVSALSLIAMLAGCAPAAETPAPTPSNSSAPSPTPSPSPTAAPENTNPVTPVGTPGVVTTGLDAPWSIVFLGDTALLSERDTGRILELLADGSTREVGSLSDIRHGGEGGLLGLAVDEQNRLFAYSTGPNGNRIQRFAVEGTPGSFTLGAAETLLDGLPASGIHNGGRLAIGPDGLLYATVGDAAQGDLAQDVNALAGKILRMTLDGEVPADNPFPGSLVYSFGHRNPQGIAWASDGTMFATEFGQNTWDELNIITPGANYGWPVVEGAANAAGYTDPVQQWAPSEASPSGMTRIGGTLFIANLRGAVLRTVPVADPTTSATFYAGEYGRLRTVTEAPDGTLWFVTNNTDGQTTPGPGDDHILSVSLQ